MDHLPFDDQIKDIRQARLKEQAHLRRDKILQRFQTVWQPLTDHIQMLAEKHLPRDKRLRMVFEVKEDFQVDLNISVDTDRSLEHPDIAAMRREENRWSPGPVFHFYKRSDNTVTGLVSGRLTLKDVFSANGANDCALVYVDIGERDPKLKGAAIHPARMDSAKVLLEYWLAKQIAFGFDADWLNPRSTLEISMKRTDSGPERTP